MLLFVLGVICNSLYFCSRLLATGASFYYGGTVALTSVSTQTEATEVFFAVTKLFQSKDSNLRRMVYLIIKEICPSADEVGNCYL